MFKGIVISKNVLKMQQITGLRHFVTRKDMKPTNEYVKKMLNKSIEDIGDFSQNRSQYKKHLHSLRYKYKNELTLLEEQKQQELKRKTNEMLRENELESQEAQSHKKKKENNLLSQLTQQKKEDEKIARQNYLLMMNYRKFNCARHLADLREESKTWWKVTDNIDDKLWKEINKTSPTNWYSTFRGIN